MKNIKQIRESYKKDTSSEEASDIKNLFEDGLLDERKLSLVERALKKEACDQTISDRKMIKNLAEQLIIHYNVDRTGTVEVLDESVKRDTKEYLAKYDPSLGGNKFPTDKDMPQVLILKRKAIRIYPDNQKVALYYSDTLNKYVTIPFGAVGINERYEAIANAAYKTAQTKVVRGKRIPGKLDRFVAKNIPIGRESDPELGKALEKRFGYKVDLAKIQNQNIDNLSGLSDASKLGLKHGAMARRFLTNLLKRKKADKKETNPETEAKPVKNNKEPLTPEQEKVKSDVSGRMKTARKLGTQAKNPDLSPAQQATKRNTARRYASYAQTDKAKAGIKESFSDKVSDKRELNELTSVAARGLALAGRTSAGKKAGELLADFLKKRTESKPGTPPSTRPEPKKPGNKPDDRTPDTAPEAPKQKTEPKPADKKTEAKPTPKKQSRLQRRLRVLGRRLGRALGGEGSENEKSGGSNNDVQYSKVSEPVKTPEFSKEPVSKSRAVAFDPERSVKVKQDRALQKNPFGVQQQQQQTNESVIKQLYNVDGKTRINIGEDKVVINKIIANKITTLYESLNGENKEKMSLKLNESTESFKKILEFAVRQK